MQRVLGLTGVCLLFSGLAIGQIKNQFTVEDNTACESIKLQIKANSGNCFIKPSHNPEVLNVFSNQQPGAYSHQFRKEVKGKVCEVFLALEDAANQGFSQSISYKVFSSEKPTYDKLWKMYLTDNKPYDLELFYGLGMANIDLSGLSVKNLKINTASADVTIGYYNQIENLIQMDTLALKVDLGSVNAKNISLAKSKYILADVGFGNIMLDFSTTPVAGNTIKGSVGAGNLVIILPTNNQAPVSVKIKESWLCSVKMPKAFTKMSDGSYANDAYQKDSKNALNFDLDVSMGNIVFKQISQ
ncbi:MAG: hypothetical protein QY309_00640 [Cyclobacteriaceae bacterium]|nr:MAG: hypothetical protein QY309_00640 [Cyclobacteriaceae bacterium]